MTNEEKNLMLKDLCGRLPHGVFIDYSMDESLKGLHNKADRLVATMNECDGGVYAETNGVSYINIESIRPLLRPMESMTLEEKCEHYRLKGHSDWQAQDYLDSIHVDYRGLIWKGLALEAPEGTYENTDDKKL